MMKVQSRSLDTHEALKRTSCPLVDDASRIAIPRIIRMVRIFLQDTILERIHNNIHIPPDLAAVALIIAVPGVVVLDTDVEKVGLTTAWREIDLKVSWKSACCPCEA